MPKLHLVEALLIVGTLVLAGRGVESPGAEDGPAPERAAPPAPEAVECTELWAHPGRWLGREVTVRVQFRDWIEGWDPFLTRFGRGEFRAFAAWGEEQHLWVREEFDAPRARLFVRRGSAADWALERPSRYDAFELTLAVRSVFADAPWAEVVAVRPLVRTVAEGTVLHGTRALERMERHAWELADAELERALAAPLPDRARLELERLRELCAEAKAEVESRPLLRRSPR